MKKKIIYGLLFAVAMVTASSSFVSCKDYEGDYQAEQNEQYRSLKAALDAQQSELQKYLLKSDYHAIEDTTALHNWVDAIQNRLGNYLLKDDYKAIEDTTQMHNWIAAINHSVNDILVDTAKWNAYAALIEANNRLIVSLGDTLNHFVFMWGDNLADAYTNAAKAKDIALSYDADTAAINRAVEKAQAVADSAWNYVNKGMAVDRNGETKEDLQAWVKYFEAADDALQEQIDSLRKDVDNILGTMKRQITGVIIQGAYSPVLGYGSLPFGVQTNLLAAYAGKNETGKDVKFPTANAGFYADLNGEDDEPAITEGDFEYLNGLGLWPASETLENGEFIISDAADNAGKLYLTVNPTKIDFEGTNFKLVNSKAEQVKVDLTPLAPADEVLYFGWTRTNISEEAANGLYAVNAHISKENVADMQPNIKKGVIVDAAKKVINEHSKTSVKDLAQAVFNGMQNVLQRNAVQAEWFDATIGENRAYTSEYAIAAAAVQPLSYSFLKDVNVPNTRYTRLPKFDKLFVMDQFHLDINIDSLTITEAEKADGKYVILLEMPGAYFNKEVVEGAFKVENNQLVLDETYYTSVSGVSIYGDGYGNTNEIGVTILKDKYGNTITDENGKPIEIPHFEFRSGYVYIDYTPMFEEMFGSFNDAFKPFGSLGDNLNSQFDGIADQVNSYINRYNSLATRLNSAIESLPVRLNNMLQPTLLFQSANGISRLSASSLATTHIALNGQAEGEINLLPTSYSLDLLAPAYKKSLIVTNVYKKDAATGVNISAQGAGNRDGIEDALIDLNGQLKDFASFQSYGFDNVPTLKVKKEYAGMTFEIAYTAVDYAGRVAGRKFYFTVGE